MRLGAAVALKCALKALLDISPKWGTRRVKLLCGARLPKSKEPSTAARTTASVRVLTASFKKTCLTCDFTVSGEISRARAMCLLEEPWLIIARTSRSRTVSVSTPLPSCASRSSHRESRLPAKGETSFDLVSPDGMAQFREARTSAAVTLPCLPPKCLMT